MDAIVMDFPPAVRYSWPQIVLGKLLTVLYRLIGLLSDIVFFLIYRNRTDRLPPICSDLLMKSASALAEMIRRREISSEQLVTVFLERIDEINPILNCVTEDRRHLALAEARAVDKMLSSDDRSQCQLQKELPFLGVPFSTKDSVAIAGMLQTAGLHSRRDCVASRDAPVVALMRASGAIPLAHTNVPELCMWWETSNLIYGHSRNPYCTSRIVGGSSGGEACLLAAAGSPMGIGSDIGGSIRMPCFFNGIHGLKPSSNIVSNEGQIPVPRGLLNTYQVTGPMCRFASDLRPLISALSAERRDLLRLEERPTLSAIKFYYLDEDAGFPFGSPVSSELRSAYNTLIHQLRTKRGVHVQRLRVPALFHQLQMWTNKMHAEEAAPSFAQELAGEDENGSRKAAISPLREMAKWCLGRSSHTLPGLCLAAMEQLLVIDTTYITMCDQLRRQLNVQLSDSAVLIYPTHPTVAPYCNQPLFKSCNFAYTAIFNVLQLPAVAIPLGLCQSAAAVPLGVQLVAAERCDHVLLSAAEQLEQLTGGWRSPSHVLH